MNTNPESQKFCEQCGAQLKMGIRFCEECGHPLSTEPPSSAGNPKPAPLGKGGKLGLIAVGVFSLILVVGGFGWWIGRGAGTPPEVNPDQRPQVRRQIRPSELAVEETGAGSASHEPSRQIDDTTSATEQSGTALALPAWLQSQAWFQSLSDSMSTGVSLSVMSDDSEDPQWNLVQLREIHSPGSDFDPEVSPTVGIFRVSADRRTTEWLNVVVDEWESIDAFLADRNMEGDPAYDVVAGEQVYTPAMGAAERTAICDAMRDFIISDNRDRKLPKFLFKIEHIFVDRNDQYAAFQGFPVKPDGTALPEDLLGDMVFTTLLKKKNGVWKIVVDLSRSDVPGDEEVNEIRGSIPAGFPTAVMPYFWRNLLK